MKAYYIFLPLLMLTAHSLSAQQITKEAIEHAEKIIGLEFNDAKRDSMLGSLESYLSRYEKIRNTNLNNSVFPALLFNPIPAGFKFSDVQKPVKFSDYSYIKMPDDINELAFYSIGELAELIRTKQISSKALTQFFIGRLKKYDPALRCVISFTEERALIQAENMDKELSEGNYRGLLHGIPFGSKDLLSAKGYKTTWGAMPFKDQVIDEDAAVISKLEEAGAVLCAKLTLGALAWGDVWFDGKTRNPWDTIKGSSGSSAGSSAAVSAGLLPFAIGSETHGSIISPSTVCGTTGLRPTYGRVSRTGAMALSWSMDKLGPISRNAEDLAIVFNAIYGDDETDQSLYDFPFNYSPVIDIKNLKVGYLKNDFERDYPFRTNDSIALALLRELGAELIPIELPGLPVAEISFILSAEAAAAFDDLTRSGKDDLMVRQIKNSWPNVFRAARFIPAVEYINANRIRTLLIQEMEQLMNEVDLYIAPSWVGTNLLLTNLTGYPAVVLPNGFSEDGTPTSITFTGRLFEEGKLIAFAKLYQDKSRFHKIHPPLFVGD